MFFVVIFWTVGEMFVGQKMTYGFDTTEDGFEYHIGVNHIGKCIYIYIVQNLIVFHAAKESKRVCVDGVCSEVKEATDRPVPELHLHHAYQEQERRGWGGGTFLCTHCSSTLADIRAE